MLVTILSFSDPNRYEMAKNYLESEGFECFGKDEIMNRTYMTNMIGGIMLQVDESVAQEAIQLLIEGGYATPEDYSPTPEIQWISKILDKFRSKNG